MAAKFGLHVKRNRWKQNQGNWNEICGENGGLYSFGLEKERRHNDGIKYTSSHRIHRNYTSNWKNMFECSGQEFCSNTRIYLGRPFKCWYDTVTRHWAYDMINDLWNIYIVLRANIYRQFRFQSLNKMLPAFVQVDHWHLFNVLFEP
jgi:hypothetical protein